MNSPIFVCASHFLDARSTVYLLLKKYFYDARIRNLMIIKISACSRTDHLNQLPQENEFILNGHAMSVIATLPFRCLGCVHRMCIDVNA